MMMDDARLVEIEKAVRRAEAEEAVRLAKAEDSVRLARREAQETLRMFALSVVPELVAEVRRLRAWLEGFARQEEESPIRGVMDATATALGAMRALAGEAPPCERASGP